jgi:enoyl-[acyl-carrier protein] reductase II
MPEGPTITTKMNNPNKSNRITTLFNIKYPIVQGGMIWCSGWKLASAVSNAGGLGLIGTGSMYPEVAEEHIKKCKAATNKPFGVNIPLLYPQTDEIVSIVIKEGVKIVFTSAGNPAKYTSLLKENGITVVHVVANKKFALKAVAAGVDALVAEGFEAGGHNGYEETTTMVMIPMIKNVTDIPLIAAGGIASGQAIFAAIALGADGVQIGSRFAASLESSAHLNFQNAIVQANDGDTLLTLKQVIPVRLIKNEFLQQVQQLEKSGATKEDLIKLLGRGRAKKGMFEGDTAKGELEIGQVSSMIDTIEPVEKIMHDLISEFNQTSNSLNGLKL